MSSTILITGASGRVGSLLARELARPDRTLRLTDLQPGDGIVAADILDGGAMSELMHGVDAVIHLAGHPNSRDWATLERSNMQGARVVFEAAITAGITRILYASSIHAVGLHPADACLDAGMTLAPGSPYGVSKAYGETLLHYLCQDSGVAGFALRIGSFRPKPGNARELRTWLSPGDMVRLADSCLTSDEQGFTVVWGISANRRARVDRQTWARIGYAPEDEAEVYLDALAADGVDVDRVSEWPFLGAHFVSPSIIQRVSGRTDPF